MVQVLETWKPMLMEELGIKSDAEWAQQAEIALDGFDGVKTLVEGRDPQVLPLALKHAVKCGISAGAPFQEGQRDVLTFSRCMQCSCRHHLHCDSAAHERSAAILPPSAYPGAMLYSLFGYALQWEELTLDEMVTKALPRDHPMYMHVASSLEEIKRNPFWPAAQKQKFVGSMLKEITR